MNDGTTLRTEREQREQREQRAQERALQQERLGVRASGDRSIAEYRLVARVLRDPPLAPALGVFTVAAWSMAVAACVGISSALALSRKP